MRSAHCSDFAGFLSRVPVPGLREPSSGAPARLADMRRDFGPLAGGLREAFAPGDPRFERPFICAPRPPLLAALRLVFVAMTSVDWGGDSRLSHS